MLHLQGHLTSEIAGGSNTLRRMSTQYDYDYARVIELAQDGRSVSQTSFLTKMRPQALRQSIAL